jgi:hypothetical protein
MSWTLGIRALVSVDRWMELLSTRTWFKYEVDTRNSREESNITATLGYRPRLLFYLSSFHFSYILKSNNLDNFEGIHYYLNLTILQRAWSANFKMVWYVLL